MAEPSGLELTWLAYPSSEPSASLLAHVSLGFVVLGALLETSAVVAYAGDPELEGENVAGSSST